MCMPAKLHIIVFTVYNVCVSSSVIEITCILYSPNDTECTLCPNHSHHHAKSVTLPLNHIHLCHSTVGPHCLSCWLNHLFGYLLKYNLSNELVLGQSITDGVYCSVYMGWPVIKIYIYLLHFGSSNGFHSFFPVVFTEAILDKERTWKKKLRYCYKCGVAIT